MADRRARLRACIGCAGLAVVLLGSFAGSAASAPARRVVVVWLDGTSIDEWARSGGPQLRAMLDEGAAGIVQTTSGTTPRKAAALIGTAAAARPGVRDSLAEILTRADRPVGFVASRDAQDVGALFPEATPFAPGSNNLFYRLVDPSYPGGTRADVEALSAALIPLLSRAGLVIVAPGDTARIDAVLDGVARERWIARALASADRVIAAARVAVGADGTVLVLSAPGPRAREARGDHLGAVAVVGPGFAQGALTSATTRVPGLVSLIDVAPTILRAAALPSDPSLRGAAMTVSRGAGVARARRLDRDLTTAARARPRVLAILFGALSCASLLAALLFVAGRGRAPRGRTPRAVPLIILTACALAPAALLAAHDWRALVLASVATLALLFAVGARWCVPVAGVIGGLSPAVVTLLMPARAAALTIGGARAAALPPGTDPALVGLALCAGLIGLGALSDARPLAPWLRAAAALVLGAGAALLAADLRMLAVAAFTVAVFIARECGWSLPRTSIGVGALAAVAAVLVVLSGPEPFVTAAEVRAVVRSHLAGFDLSALTVLAGAPLLAAVGVRRAEAARASFGSPGARAAITASLVLAGGIALAYPGGVSAAAWALLPAAALVGATLLGVGTLPAQRAR